MAGIKAELVLDFKENGLSDIDKLIKNINTKFKVLEKVVKKVKLNPVFTRQLTTSNKKLLQIQQNLVKLKKELESVNNFNIHTTNIEAIYSDIVKTIKGTKELIITYDSIKTTIIQTKNALKEFNTLEIARISNNKEINKLLKDQNTIISQNMRLTKTLKEQEDLRIKNLNKLRATNRTADRASDLKKVNNEISKLSHFYDKLEIIASKFNDKLAYMKKIDFPTAKLENFKSQFESLYVDAERTKDLFHLNEFIKEFNSVANAYGTLDRSIRGVSIGLITMKNKVKDMSATTADEFKKDVLSAKKLETTLRSLSDRYTKITLRLKEHINARRKWANPADIQKAEAELQRYETLIKRINAVSLTLQQRAAVGILDVNQIKAGNKALINLRAELSALDKKLIQTKGALNNTSFIKWASNVLKTATAYGTLYLGLYEVFNVIRNSVAYVVEYNKNLRQLQAVLGITGNKAKYLEDRLIKLGISYGGTLKDINETALSLARAGVETNKLAKATEVVIQMARLTGDTFQISADAIVTFMTVYRDAGVTVKELGDELAYVANASKLSTEDIATFSNYALQAGKAAGITRHMIEAMAIAMSNAGTRAETIGTSIRKFATLATDNAKPVQEFFDKLGMAQKTFSYLLTRSADDANKTMIWLLNKLKGMTNQEFQQATAGMEILAKQSLTIMRQNADQILSQFHHLQSGVSGELDKANIAADTYLGTWEKLKNAFGEAFIKLSDQLFPAIQEFGFKLINIVNTISNNMPVIIDYFSKLKTIIEAIVAVVGAIGIAKGIGALKEGLATAITAGDKLKFVLGGVKGVLFAIGSFFIKNPILLGLTLATGVAVSLYNTLQKNNEELLRTNVFLREQTKLNNLIAQHDQLIHQKLKLQEQLESAVLQNNLKQAKVIQNKLDLLDKELANINNIKNATEERINKLNEEKEIVKKYLEYQRKQEELQNLIKQYDKDHNDVLAQKIILLEKEVKELAKYKQTVKDIVKEESKLKQTSVFKPVKEQTPNVGNVIKGNTNWQNNFNKQTPAKVTLPKIKLPDTKALDNLAKNNLKTYTDTLGVLRNIVKEVKNYKNIVTSGKSIPVIFTITDAQIQQFKKLSGSIKDLYKQGYNVTELTKLFEKQLNGVIHKGLQSLHKVTKSDMTKIFDNINVKLPKSLKKDIDELLNSIKNAKTPQDIAKINEEFIKLQLTVSKLSSGKVKSALNVLLSGLNNNIQKINELNSQRINIEGIASGNALNGKFKAVKVEIKPYMKQADFIKIKKEIDQLTNQYIQAMNNTKLMKNGDKTPLIDNLKEAITQVRNLDTQYKNLYDIRIQKEKELKDIINKINNTTFFGEKGQEKLNKLLSKKKELQSEVNSLFKNELSLQKQILEKEIAVEKVKQQQLQAMREMQKETAKLKGQNTWASDLYANADQWRQKIGLINFNKEGDQQRIDTYFNWLSAKIFNKNKELQQKQKEIDQSIRTINGANTGFVGAWADIYKKYQQDIKILDDVYNQKAQIIQAKQQQLLQMEETGQISKMQMLKQYADLEVQLEEAKAERIKKINQANYTAGISMLGSYLGEFTNIFEQFRQAGYAKDKKWFATYKALQVATTIINTYAAAQKAMAELPYPINIAASGLAITQGLMKVAIIKAQKYHTGGYVDRKTFNDQSMGGLRNDEVPTILQKGEYVLSRNDLAMISKLSSPNVSVTANAPTPEVVILNSVDDSKMGEYLQSREGREIIKNVVHA